MSTDTFFDESSEQSAVKAAIVSKYFWVWAKVIMPQAQKSTQKIAYLDLFAGPGRYKTGAKSTPLLILEKAILDTQMSEMLVTLFNDKDDQNAQDLQNAINQLTGVDKLRHKPTVMNKEVGTEMVKLFSEAHLVPTLFFVDPWGYKGLSLQLVDSVLKDWGCDCIFFFNYNRINMGLNNPVVKEHMEALFGQQRAGVLSAKLEGMSPDDRESAIIEELCNAMASSTTNAKRYVLPFGFKNDAGSRTSHHLIFVSKHPLGYSLMKGIMANESSMHEQGVPSFHYSPADKRFPLLFELNRPLDDLEGMLLADFSGQTLVMSDIYERHHIGRRFIKKNYKDALKQMEAKALIQCDPAKRKKDTFADTVRVSFPKKGGDSGKIKH